MPIDLAGNSLGTARSLTIGSSTQTFTDWVGNSDTNDFYRFSLSSRSSFNLSLSGLAADADVTLIRDLNNNGVVDSGETIASSAAGGITSESINSTLDAGTYYIRVYPYSGETYYNLGVSATTIPDYAGNTLSTARQISVGSTTSTYTDWVGSTDTNDFYRFTLTNRSNFNLSLSGLAADADVTLIRDLNNNGVADSGETIASSAAAGITSESINSTLDAGTYYIRVYPYSGQTSYNLGVSATTIADNAGNTLSTARQITVGSTTSSYTDWVGSTDTNDYYRFTLGSRSNFNLYMNGLDADADVQLLNSSGTVITTSQNSGILTEYFTATLDSGTYYIRVYPYGTANTDYNLSLSAIAVANDYAGNTLSTARQITVGTTATTYTDWVGSLDTNDYYRFTLNGTANFNLALNGLSTDADVQLLDSNGAVIQGSYNNNAIAESINRTLSAGTYYIRVYPYAGETNYNLTVSTGTITIPDSAGNTLSTARNIDLLSTPTTFNDWVGSSDTNDYYRFSLTGTSNFSLSLNGLTGNADIQLLNSTGAVIQTSSNTGTTAEAIATQLAAGTYYLRVYPQSGANTNYSLNASATPLVSTPADWTFMVYLDADNNLEGFGIDDFLEMAQVGSNQRINIVVQMDRIGGYDSRYGDWTGTRRGVVRYGDTPDQNWGTNLGEINMGAQSSLSDFSNWAMTNYRANNYALVLWNHGGGHQGIAWDDSNNDDRLELREVSGALGSLSRNIDVLGTDACLMGMAEFAHQIRNNASVLVGSEELIPGQGWNYTTVLSDLTASPTMSATALGTVMVNRYGQYYSSVGNNGTEETLSAINLVNLRSTNPNNLSVRLSQFATTFMNSSTASDRRQLGIHRDSAGIFENDEYRDLGTILSRVVNDTTMTGSIRTAAQNALTAYNSSIIQNYSSISGRGTGLSIYLQARGSSVDSYYNSTNLGFATDTTWDEFLRWWQTA